jgi:hypothetical protein
VTANLKAWGLPRTRTNEYYELWFSKDGGRVSAGSFTVSPDGRGEFRGGVPDLAGDYGHVSVTLEKLPDEPRADSAKTVLSGDLR